MRRDKNFKGEKGFELFDRGGFWEGQAKLWFLRFRVTLTSAPNDFNMAGDEVQRARATPPDTE